MEHYVPILVFSLIAITVPIILLIVAKLVRAGSPDPVKAEGTDAQKSLAFQQAYGALANRIRAFAALPFDENTYMQDLGVPGLMGEEGYSTNERRTRLTTSNEVTPAGLSTSRNPPSGIIGPGRPAARWPAVP